MGRRVRPFSCPNGPPHGILKPPRSTVHLIPAGAPGTFVTCFQGFYSMLPAMRVTVATLLLALSAQSALASDPLLELAEKSTFADSPHRLSAEHNLSVALTKAAVLDPARQGPGAEGEKADFARTMAQLATGYTQLGADAIAANVLHTAGQYSNDYAFDYAAAVFLAGQPSESMTAFEQALDARPDDATGKVTAGFFHLMAGDANRASKLLHEALATTGATRDDRLYASVYLALAAEMMGSEPRRVLAGLPEEPNRPWPFGLREAIVSGSTRHLDVELLADRLAFQDRLCEALFYVGFSREIDRKADDAQRFYRAALDTRAYGIRAYSAARFRLADMLAGPRNARTP